VNGEVGFSSGNAHLMHYIEPRNGVGECPGGSMEPAMENLNLVGGRFSKEFVSQLPTMGISIEEAIRISGFSRSGIYRHMRAGDIIGRKDGRSLLIDVDSLQRCIAALPRATFTSPTQSEAA
jgi:hypothetical protein